MEFMTIKEAAEKSFCRETVSDICETYNSDSMSQYGRNKMVEVEYKNGKIERVLGIYTKLPDEIWSHSRRYNKNAEIW